MRRYTYTLLGVCISLGAFLVPTVARAQTQPNWDAVAQCESSGNWAASTGNGFSGGLQFTQSTWSSNGGTGSPANATRDQQIAVANNVLATQGPGAWPHCFKSGGTAAPKPQSAPAPKPQSAPAAPVVGAPRTTG